MYTYSNAFSTLFVARLSYETSDRKLKREFEQFGPVVVSTFVDTVLFSALYLTPRRPLPLLLRTVLFCSLLCHRMSSWSWTMTASPEGMPSWSSSEKGTWPRLTNEPMVERLMANACWWMWREEGEVKGMLMV